MDSNILLLPDIRSLNVLMKKLGSGVAYAEEDICGNCGHEAYQTGGSTDYICAGSCIGINLFMIQ